MTAVGQPVMPPARSGHVAVCIGKFMVVWGGYNDEEVSFSLLLFSRDNLSCVGFGR